MWWSNSLRKIDIFGTKFGFKIKNEESYKTVFGGILTIMSIITTVIFAVFFGQDFYYRINPSVYSDSMVPEKYDPPETLTSENFIENRNLKVKVAKKDISHRKQSHNKLDKPTDFGRNILNLHKRPADSLRSFLTIKQSIIDGTRAFFLPLFQICF